MKENEDQSTVNSLEKKLDEIKNTLRMRTETKSAIDDLEKDLHDIQTSLHEIQTSINKSATRSKKAILLTPMAVGLSFGLAGLSAAKQLTPSWGWAYFFVGSMVVLISLVVYWKLEK